MTLSGCRSKTPAISAVIRWKPDTIIERLYQVGIAVDKGHRGDSVYSFGARVRMGFEGLTSFSEKPLMIVLNLVQPPGEITLHLLKSAGQRANFIPGPIGTRLAHRLTRC